MPTAVAAPDGPPRGAVIVIQDAFGVTDYLTGVAADLAAAGWLAIAPALFHRTGAPVIPWDAISDAQPHIRSLTGATVLADLDGCLVWLDQAGIGPERTAVIGFCMGGTVAFIAAVERPIAAAVTFYGQAGPTHWEGVAPAYERGGELQAPWLGLFGETDELVPVADVERLEKAAAAAAVPTRVIVYPGAGHAFHRVDTPGFFHPEAAKAGWAKCVSWLDTHLPA